MTAAVATRDEARVAWLDLMIPQLWAGGFNRLAAEYSVERDRLQAILAAKAAAKAATWMPERPLPTCSKRDQTWITYWAKRLRDGGDAGLLVVQMGQYATNGRVNPNLSLAEQRRR